MGLRGPAPTPSSVLENRGSWRAKINDKEPVPELLSKKYVPEFLSKAEKKIWKEVSARLINLGVLTELDWRLLERYCVTYNLWKRAVRNPLSKHTEIDAYATQLLKIEQQLGLTPSSRTRIEKVESDSNNKEEQAQNKHNYFKCG